MDRAIAYAILGVTAEATPDDIRSAYRRRAFATHPDRAGGDAATFHAVCDAYQSLSDPASGRAQELGPASGPATSAHVPPTDAARVLFEYLGDLASEMILNGATHDMVVSFLAREGCPESVARALERDLRDRVRPPSDARAASRFAVPSAAAPPVAPSAPGASPTSPRTWLVAAAATATIAASLLGAWFVAAPARAPVKRDDVTPPRAAIAPAPIQPSAPAPIVPPRGAPARPPAKQASRSPRPPARERVAGSRLATSAELDAEREELEEDQRRFAAEVAELDAERARIDADEAALASTSDIERYASLTPRKAAYNARLAVARRTERALQLRVRELNAQITAYNERMRSAR